MVAQGVVPIMVVVILVILVVGGVVPVDLIEGVLMVVIMVVIIMVIMVLVPNQPVPRQSAGPRPWWTGLGGWSGAVAVGPAPAVPDARPFPQGGSLLLSQVGETRRHRRMAVRELQAGAEHHGKNNSIQPQCMWSTGRCCRPISVVMGGTFNSFCRSYLRLCTSASPWGCSPWEWSPWW